jgi:hypothetical protein
MGKHYHDKAHHLTQIISSLYHEPKRNSFRQNFIVDSLVEDMMPTILGRQHLVQ